MVENRFYTYVLNSSADIVYFNHTYGCQNCTVIGMYKDRRMSFTQIHCEPRTDQSFRERQEPQHHRGSSLLENLPIDMVADFVVADPLHLLDLGVMRKLMRIWIDGKVTKQFKITNTDKLKLNDALLQCNQSLPSEIHRSVRSLQWLKFWKGNEFRTVLLYIGITVFKQVLKPVAYEHFLHLFCAVTICSSDSYLEYVRLAKILFDEYVETYIQLYGASAITSNVHNLCHIVENIERFGNLNSISTYPFENAARHIKLKLKQCDKALEQISLRISEIDSMKRSMKSKNTVANYIFKFPFEILGLPHVSCYRYICIKNSVIFSSKKDNDKWFMTKNNEIVEFEYAYKLNGQSILCGRPIIQKDLFFLKPFHSSHLNIYASDGIRIDDLYTYSIIDVKCKMICLKCDEKNVFIPLLHSLDIFKEIIL